ncbi:DeoR/GlpR family DNA-binding transcription regulator [Ferrovibrio sp. MS7]|uniref:DeoR/GlpR family DNA-binding transcription regulator n=1 Tax=Ferrovibrio plantarum TaxID=3119164 RepID=UPI001B47BC86|nr:DeoR/GlpR transcriptional regulator [Ferrovibrio sp.]
MRDSGTLNIRQRSIAEWLQKTESASIQDLSEQFQVSDETIRRDLRFLEQQGLVEKFHGGARLNEERKEAPFQRRMREMADAKRRIGIAASRLIPDESTVFLDNSSTSCFLARELAKRSGLSIITLSLEVAKILSAGSGRHRVILPGGELRVEDQTLIGADAIRFVSQFTPSICVISVAAVTPEHGCMDFDLFETEFKRVMMPLSKTVLLLADSSKFRKSGLVKVCDLAAFDIMVTEAEPPGVIADQLAMANASLVLAGGEQD